MTITKAQPGTPGVGIVSQHDLFFNHSDRHISARTASLCQESLNHSGRQQRVIRRCNKHGPWRVIGTSMSQDTGRNASAAGQDVRLSSPGKCGREHRGILPQHKDFPNFWHGIQCADNARQHRLSRNGNQGFPALAEMGGQGVNPRPLSSQNDGRPDDWLIFRIKFGHVFASKQT
jgi:hypothetical protein